MKQVIFLITLSCSLICAGQVAVDVSGQFLNAPGDSIYIAKFTGNGYINYKGMKSDKQGKFNLKTSVPAPDYYVIRVGNLHTNIILRDSSKIKVYGDKNNLKDICNFVGSDESQAMNQFAVRMERWNIKKDSAYRAMTAMAPADTMQKRVLNEYMTREYLAYMNDRQQFIAANPNSAALIVALVSLDINNELDAWISVLNQLATGFGICPTVREYVNFTNNHIKQKEEEKKES